MTRKTTRRLLISGAAILLLTAGAAAAQPPGPHGGQGRFAGPPGIGMALLQGPLGERLELSDEQRDSIRTIVEAERESVRPWIEDLKTRDEAVEEAVHAEPFDEEAVRAAARQAADIRVELAVARARVADEIRGILTPDQRETLGELRAERREMHGRRYGGRHGPGNGPRNRVPGS